MLSDGRIGHLVSIDDSEFDQLANARIVERSGLVDEFRTFLDAQDALDFLRSHQGRPVDAILLDINMPGMSGFEFLDAATKELGGNFRGIVVLMLTTSLSAYDMERARSYSAVRDYFNKPLSQQLLEQIVQHLSPSS